MNFALANSHKMFFFPRDNLVNNKIAIRLRERIDKNGKIGVMLRMPQYDLSLLLQSASMRFDSTALLIWLELRLVQKCLE
jgi:hypothetical protein